MYDWVPAVAIIAVTLVCGTTVVLRGPMGKALAEWIRGWSKTDEHWLAVQAAKHGAVLGSSESLLTEVDELKRRLAEVEERLDFTERLLARERDPERLAPPR
ncbi:MAG TPA: hypothetical protein VKH16_10620 [Gemmatimonadales bacterium]|nr:hypothetical protein [Gemmatimonadales bacterium]